VTPALVFAALLALALGVALGWLFASRGGAARAVELASIQARAADADLLRRTRDAVEAERNAALRDLAALRAGAEARNREAAEISRRFDDAAGRLATLSATNADLTARAEERERAHAASLRQLADAREQLGAHFGDAAAKVLASAQDEFLKRADARFQESERVSGERLGRLLQPVNDRLLRYEEGVAKVEAERRDAFGALTAQVELMRAGQERVSSEAAKLVNALRNAPKARGRWGEQQLRNVLESCGLSEHADFQTEVSVGDGEGGRYRPDVIVRVPGGKQLIIDAKVSLNAYQDAFGAVDEAERARGLAAHAAAMRAHVSGLGNKSYWAQFADAPDYVIMFVPGEHFLSAALENDPTLWDYAFERRVLLATPTNLIAIAQTVAAVWRQEKLATEARAIGNLGKELYDRLAKAAEDLRKVGGGLTSAVNNYNSFVSSFESRVLVSGRRFRDLNVETGSRELGSVDPVEALPRYGIEPPQIGQD